MLTGKPMKVVDVMIKRKKNITVPPRDQAGLTAKMLTKSGYKLRYVGKD